MGRGLLWNGTFHTIDGVEMLGPGDAPWIRVSLPEDGWYRPTTEWIRQIILHTTKGEWPQSLRTGRGPGGKDRIVADFWFNDPVHSSAHIVVDNDGSITALCDLKRIFCYHATVSNNWSIGIEMYQENADAATKTSPVYTCVYDSTVKLVHKLCELAPIPKWVPSRIYDGHPIARMTRGGPDMAGVFGHRDNTESRGRGDPGDVIFSMLEQSGFRRINYETYEDIRLGKAVQSTINKMFGTKLTVDGLMGPSTLKACVTYGVDYNTLTPWHSVEAP